MTESVATSGFQPATDPISSVIAAIGGGMLLGSRPEKASPTRALATVAGLALIGMAAHAPLTEALKRTAAKRRSGKIRLSLVIERPVEEVFAFCANFENFPRFISALREVRDTGDGRSHWCAEAAFGKTVEWDAVTTKFVTNSVIGWRSKTKSPVHMTGLLRFLPEGRNTCLRVEIDYDVATDGIAGTLAAMAKPRRARQIERDIQNLRELELLQRG
jgi:uncharacterized membrane protein